MIAVQKTGLNKGPHETCDRQLGRNQVHERQLRVTSEEKKFLTGSLHVCLFPPKNNLCFLISPFHSLSKSGKTKT